MNIIERLPYDICGVISENLSIEHFRCLQDLAGVPGRFFFGSVTLKTASFKEMLDRYHKLVERYPHATYYLPFRDYDDDFNAEKIADLISPKFVCSLNYNQLFDVTEELKNDPTKSKIVYLHAISDLGYNMFNNIPDDLKDYDIYLAAVTQNGDALQYVPENLRDRKMCLAAVGQFHYELKYIPEELIDYKFCLAAVAKNGFALKCVPERLKDYKMCLTAVTDAGNALKYVPERLKNHELCLSALAKHSSALEYVPRELIDYELCLDVVTKSGRELEYVPEELKDHKMCLTAVTNFNVSLRFVPEKLRDLEICITALTQKNNCVVSCQVTYRHQAVLKCVPNQIKDEINTYITFPIDDYHYYDIYYDLKDKLKTLLEK